MSLAWSAARGTLWVAGLSTRVGFNTVILAASVVVSVSRTLQAAEEALEVLGAVRAIARGWLR